MNIKRLILMFQQTKTRAVYIPQMQKRAFWILIVLIVLATLALVLSFAIRGHNEGFERLMTAGRGYLEKGEATNAVKAYAKAVKAAPESIDARLNLANAFLLANNSQGVIEQCQKVIELDPNQPAAYYLMGCAHLRENQAEQAVQAFQQSQKIDPAVDALTFQLGLAQDRAGLPVEDAALVRPDVRRQQGVGRELHTGRGPGAGRHRRHRERGHHRRRHTHECCPRRGVGADRCARR
jgi:tetratricopeptide (TPR) repeat protein